MKLSKNAQHYFTTAIWSSLDDNDEPLDANYDYTDLSEEAIKQAEADIDKFIELAGPLLDDHDYSQILHDFWLTRNRHGAGFWDGDYDAPYFRWSNKSDFEADIKFKNVIDLKTKLAKIVKKIESAQYVKKSKTKKAV